MLKKGSFMCVASLFVAGVIILGTVMVAKAQINLPADSEGRRLPPSEAPCVVTNFTANAAEAVVRSAGPGYVAWIALSTAPVGTQYALLIDSSAVSSGVTPMARLFASTETKVHVFSPPARFANGLTVQQTAGLWGSVCTRLYSTASP